MNNINFLCDYPLYANAFVECYTGFYYTNTDTFNEAKHRLMCNHIGVSDGWTISEINNIPDGTTCVLVMFSKEENYTEHEYRIMRIQKKYIARFKRRLADYNETD